MFVFRVRGLCSTVFQDAVVDRVEARRPAMQRSVVVMSTCISQLRDVTSALLSASQHRAHQAQHVRWVREAETPSVQPSRIEARVFLPDP